MHGRQRINRLPAHTRKLYVVSGEFHPSDVQMLADAAVERMFDKGAPAVCADIPLYGVKLSLIERADRMQDKVHQLHSDSLQASYETSTASATIDSTCDSYGSVSAFGRLRITEEPFDWNDPVLSKVFHDVASLMNDVAIQAVADGEGAFRFSSYTNPVR